MRPAFASTASTEAACESASPCGSSQACSPVCRPTKATVVSSCPIARQGKSLMAQRIAILAPLGRDAQVIAGILEGASLDCTIQTSTAEIIRALDDGRVGALIVAEEGLSGRGFTE